MSTWGQGSTRATRRARDTALERDDYICQLRYPGCSGAATIADHRINIASIGMTRTEADDPNDLQAACIHCHDIKTSREAAAGRATSTAKRQARKRLPVQPHPGQL